MKRGLGRRASTPDRSNHPTSEPRRWASWWLISSANVSKNGTTFSSIHDRSSASAFENVRSAESIFDHGTPRPYATSFSAWRCDLANSASFCARPRVLMSMASPTGPSPSPTSWNAVRPARSGPWYRCAQPFWNAWRSSSEEKASVVTTVAGTAPFLRKAWL